MARSPDPKSPLTPEAFAVRFRAAARVLWTLAAGILGDPTEAEDVLQEAFVSALGKLDRFDPTTDFLAWSGTFVRHIALNERRKRDRRQTSAADPVWLDGDEVLPVLGHPSAGRALPPAAIDERGTLRVDQHDFDDRVLAGLGELSETARACLLLRVVHELSYAELSAALAIPEGTAMSHVHRARALLRARLDSDDVDRTARSRPASSVETQP